MFVMPLQVSLMTIVGAAISTGAAKDEVLEALDLVVRTVSSMKQEHIEVMDAAVGRMERELAAVEETSRPPPPPPIDHKFWLGEWTVNDARAALGLAPLDAPHGQKLIARFEVPELVTATRDTEPAPSWEELPDSLTRTEPPPP